jgi:protein TonB
MNEHLQKNFKHPKTAERLWISRKVSVFILIVKTVYITEIKSRGPDRLLETEAERYRLITKNVTGKTMR